MNMTAATDKYGHLATSVLTAKGAQRNIAITKAYNELKPLIEYIVFKTTDRKIRGVFSSIIVDSALSKIFIGLEKGHYDAKYAFSTWFKTITVNCCIDTIRKYQNEPIAINENYHFVSNSSNPFISQRINSYIPSKADAQLMEECIKEEIKKALKGVKHSQKIAFMMFHLEGMKLQEISDALKMELGTVKNSIFRAKKAIRENLETRGFSLEDFILNEPTPEPKQDKLYTRIRVSTIDAFEAETNPSPAHKVAA